MLNRVTYVLLVGSLLGGCASTSNRPRIDHREVMGRPLSDAVEVPVEVAGDRVALASLACGGAFATTLGPAVNVVHFRLRVRNLDPAPVQVPVDGLTLKGAVEADLTDPLALVGPTAHPAAVEIEPGTTREIDLVFSLPASVDLEDVNGFKLVWSVRAAGRTVANETTFASDDRVQGQVARAYRPTF